MFIRPNCSPRLLLRRCVAYLTFTAMTVPARPYGMPMSVAALSAVRNKKMHEIENVKEVCARIGFRHRRNQVLSP